MNMFSVNNQNGSDKLGTRTSALKNFLSRNTALDTLDQSEELLQTNQGAGEDPMEMVRREIVAMISKLKKESAGDQGHASWCVAEKKSTLDTLRDKKGEFSKAKISRKN